MIIKTFRKGSLDVNCYVLGDLKENRAIIIDPGYYHPQLNKYLKENKLTPEYIIITHGHGDHMSGVPSYRKKHPKIKVLGHEADKELFTNSYINFSEETFGKPIVFEPDWYITEEDTIPFAGQEIRFLHTPGHTAGSISVVIGPYLFSGDTLLRKSIGRTDFFGGSMSEIMASIRGKLFTLPDDTIVMPGHMVSTTIGDEKNKNPFFI